MGRKGRETTVEERELIIRLHNQCKSLNEISEIIGRPRATIQHIIERVCERKSFEHSHRSARHRKLNVNVKKALMRKVKQNPESSSPKLAPSIKNTFNISISASSVRNFVRANELQIQEAR